MDVDLLKFSNNTPNSASMSDATTFLIMLHSAGNGPFSRGIDCISVLVFFLGKNIYQLCFVPLALKCRMYPNKFGE